ncbi:hypothetical protein L2E82_24680 [Cichorium intybus]|uniref:Uncharacterized protein n=1 Tax=Cichorium intybus TaxID=13427 RepID=A0ACB9E1Q4_CICIN|nr:hypothetical protein L2E82_24680 [Cichorium intybus]
MFAWYPSPRIDRKPTNHVEYPPKGRHIRKILAYTSAVPPRADVQYCLHALARRLAKTRNWTVAIKTLIVIHRTLREGDPTFREELVNFRQRGCVLQLGWDCFAWVRTYGLFLEERLECFRVLKYDIEAEKIPIHVQGQDNKIKTSNKMINRVHIGPEPTTDRFIIVMGGHHEVTIPENTIAVHADMPFTAFATFGGAFLSKFEPSQMAHALLEHMTFVHTPGVLSEEKQHTQRSYDFAGVINWFSHRCDLILFLFDPTKLDISHEFKRLIFNKMKLTTSTTSLSERTRET